MSITFEVIDLSCEQASQSFFIPQARMTTQSTTRNAIMRGWREFILSAPPKTYKKASLSGVSERIGFTAEETPRMCAGARYTWSGIGEYNNAGTLISSYSKRFFAQCPKQYWPLVPLQTNPNAISPTSAIGGQFVGYCWTPDLNSCSICDPDIVNWPLLGDVTTLVLGLDLQGFKYHPSDSTTTPTSFSVSSNFAALTALDAPNHTFTDTGHTYNVTVGSNTYQAEAVITDPPLAFPVEIISGVEGAYINWVDASNYSAILSDEYTDADALANAQVIVGTGNTAQTQPRITGYVSVFTSVVITLALSNLIVGKDYVVEVDLWEQGAAFVSTHTPKQYGFTAAATTHTITDVVPTPANFHTITVQKPTITFAPLP